MNKVFKPFAIAFVLFFMTESTIVYSMKSDPVSILSALASHLSEVLKKSQGELRKDPVKLDEVVGELASTHFCFPEMARSLVNPEIWRQSSEAEKNQFINAFKDLMIRSYGKVLLNYPDARIEWKFEPSLGTSEEERMLVRSVVYPSQGKNPIRMDYKVLNFSAGEWKIYDILIEGVSLIDGFKVQFRSILEKDGLKGLIERIKK